MAKRTVYSPVGFCIYCGADDVPLTMEHPVPEGLGGQHELPDASCEKCREVTSGFERIVLRDMLGAAREQLSAYGERHRRPGRRRQLRFPVTFDHGDGRDHTVSVDASEYPFVSVWPILDAPGILSGKNPDAPFPDLTNPGRVMVIEANTNQTAVDKLVGKYGRRPKANVSTSHTIHAGPFCRMLAKIAYATAIGNCGTRDHQIGLGRLAHETGLLALILDLPGAPLAPYLIGCACAADGSRITSIATKENNMHETILLPHPYEGGHLLTAKIQLFAPIEAPVYEVVVAMTRDSDRSESSEEAL